MKRVTASESIATMDTMDRLNRAMSHFIKQTSERYAPDAPGVFVGTTEVGIIRNGRAGRVQRVKVWEIHCDARDIADRYARMIESEDVRNSLATHDNMHLMFMCGPVGRWV